MNVCCESLTGLKVRLNTPITNVQPIRYQDTPLKSQATLGVVGYPGERDSGNYLYEHWQDVAVDLASTNMLLTYKIDTTGGIHSTRLTLKDDADSMCRPVRVTCVRQQWHFWYLHIPYSLLALMLVSRCSRCRWLSKLWLCDWTSGQQI